MCLADQVVQYIISTENPAPWARIRASHRPANLEMLLLAPGLQAQISSTFCSSANPVKPHGELSVPHIVSWWWEQANFRLDSIMWLNTLPKS